MLLDIIMKSQQLKKDKIVYLGMDPYVTMPFNVSFLFKLNTPHCFLLAGLHGVFVLNYLTNYIRVLKEELKIQWACQSPTGQIYLADSQSYNFLKIDKKISNYQYLNIEQPFNACSGMAIDVNKVLYFSDYSSSTIFSLDLQKSVNRPVELIGPEKSISKVKRRVSPMSLCLHQKYLFFIDNNTKQVMKFNLQSQQLQSRFSDAYGEPFGMLKNLNLVDDKLYFEDIEKQVLYYAEITEGKPLKLLQESDNFQSIVKVTQNRLLTLKSSNFRSRLKLIQI